MSLWIGAIRKEQEMWREVEVLTYVDVLVNTVSISRLEVKLREVLRLLCVKFRWGIYNQIYFGTLFNV